MHWLADKFYTNTTLLCLITTLEERLKKNTFIEYFLASSAVPRPFIYYLLQSSHYPYEAGLAMITNFGKFWKLHHIPSKWLNDISA